MLAGSSYTKFALMLFYWLAAGAATQIYFVLLDVNRQAATL